MATLPTREAILGHILNAHGAPLTTQPPETPDATPQPNTTTATAPSPTGVLETGIKVVDLFTPLLPGGLHQIGAGIGVGKDVLLSEMIANLGRYHGGCAVWVAPFERVAEGNFMVQEFRETGVLSLIAFVLARPGEERQALETATRYARAFALDGSPVLLGIEAALLVDAVTVEAIPQRDSITRLVITHGDDLPALAAPLVADGRICFSKVLAQQSIWPAIDPLRSTSRAIERGDLPAEHLRVARAAHETLTATPDSPRARRLLRFGNQPFTVAEAFTARPGAYVPLAETLRGYASILSGAWDQVAEEQLAWQGSLPPLS